MHYWIDGYNLLFRLPKIKGSFEEKRRLLIMEIHYIVQTLGLEATIVFDARDSHEEQYRKSHYGPLEILFTHIKKSADDAILDIIETSPRKSLLCVVSSDKELCMKAKTLGAETLSLADFFKLLSKKKKKKESQNNLLDNWQDSPQEIARLLKIFSRPLSKEDP